MPVAVCCAILGLSVGWFYKWVKAPVAAQVQRRRELDAAVRELFVASERTYGSPRIHADLLEAGWSVGENTVADSMSRQGLFGRKPKRRKGLTRQDRKAAKFGDLFKRDFTAPAPNLKWCGDITEIPTGEGKLYLATVIDLYSRRLLACPISEHPDAELVCDAIKIAAAVRGGRQKIEGVVFHSDRGSTGGFQGSSQHLDPEVECDVETQGPDGGQAGGGAAAVGGGSGVACADAFSWPAGAVACGGARVLAADRHRGQQRGRGCRDRRVNAGGGQVVSTRWRDVADQPGRAHRPLSVVR